MDDRLDAPSGLMQSFVLVPDAAPPYGPACAHPIAMRRQSRSSTTRQNAR